MNSNGFAWLITGKYWVAKCLVLVTLATITFSTTPAVLTPYAVDLPPAYELKTTNPFADTAAFNDKDHLGEQSHGAKLTSRLTGSILLYLCAKLSLHPYTAATLFGLLFLLSGILTGHQVSDDRMVGLYTGLIYAGLYASSACFTNNFMPKPFDGIAIGLAGLALYAATRGSLWLAVAVFLGCWTDEKILLSLVLITAFVVAAPKTEKQLRLQRCLAIAGAAMLYLISRAILTAALDWQPPLISEFSVVEFKLAALFAPIALWTAFEGGWIPIVMALAYLQPTGHQYRVYLLTGSVAIAIAACLLVFDTSRVAAYCFPVIVMGIALLADALKENTQQLRLLCGLAALISLLAPNFEAIAGGNITWLPPLVPLLPTLFF
jgi:hypothetical protein